MCLWRVFRTIKFEGIIRMGQQGIEPRTDSV